MMKKWRVILGIFIAFFCINVLAAESPLSLLEGTANQLLERLKQDKAKISTDPNYVNQIVRELLLPKVDVEMMSRSVLGRAAWAQATPEQRKVFSAEFTTLVIRTYASALTSYSDQEVKFFPIRGGYEGQDHVQVQSVIIPTDGPKIPMSYQLILSGNIWKVYDMSVDGVSLLQSFRTQFAADLTNGNLDVLIKKLQVHNAQTQKG